jgi:uncharacterized membrane protein YsdA (DUF1294 family)
MSTPPPHAPGRTSRGGFDAPALVGLGLLLALPAYALSRLAPQVDARLLVGGPLAWSVFAFFAYRGDKRRAQTGAWRIPESTLHLLAFLGGWPGAFLAQRRFRHKTAKLPFQFVFWLIVLGHQFAALDSLREWQFTRCAWRGIAGLTP